MISLAIAILFALWPTSAQPCAEESGETQYVCVWSDGTGDVVLNLDYGRTWITL